MFGPQSQPTSIARAPTFKQDSEELYPDEEKSASIDEDDDNVENLINEITKEKVPKMRKHLKESTKPTH